jgi:hypothetical protein
MLLCLGDFAGLWKKVFQVALAAQHPRLGTRGADQEVKARAICVIALLESGLNGASARPIVGLAIRSAPSFAPCL